MRVNRYYLSLIGACFLSTLFSQRMPSWTTKMPEDEKFYWARESVSISGLSEEEYKNKANAQALQKISMQIRTTVAGKTDYSIAESVTDSEESFSSEFEQESTTSTIADIEGAILEDDYTSSTTYWVLWKLDKAMYEKSMEKYVEAAKNQYEGFTYMEKTDPVGQLQYLIPAYEAVIKVAGVPVMYEGKNLKTVIPNKIANVTNSLRLVADGQKEFTGQPGFPLGKPLKVKIQTKKDADLSDIPIIFFTESGELEFSESVKQTSSSGKAETNVTQIVSRKPSQKVRAMIDLKEWREDRLSDMVSFEKRLDDISKVNSVLFSLDIKQVTQEKIAIIAVTQDTAMFTEDDMKRINTVLRTWFAEVSDFKLKDENKIDEIIKEYKRSAKLCTDEECQIQIGKKLGVERLLFVDVDNSPKEVSVTYYLTNIANREFEKQYGYDFSHKEWKEKRPEKPKGYKRARLKIKQAEEDYDSDKIDYELYSKIVDQNEGPINNYENAMENFNNRFIPYKNKIFYEIIDNIPEMVEDFWIRTNPGLVTLQSNTRGVKADIRYLGTNRWAEKKIEERLPIMNKEFLEGSYDLRINKLGYEKYQMRFDVAMGEFPEHFIDLKPKRPGKAALRSLFVPGRGQIYSSDADHRNRMIMGATYFFSTAALVGTSGILWNDFFKSRDVYEASRENYLNAVSIEDVSSTQSVMLRDHSTMSDKRSTAVLVSSLTAGLWLFNAIDAYFFFPAKYKGIRVSLKADSALLAGENRVRANLKWHF